MAGQRRIIVALIGAGMFAASYFLPVVATATSAGTIDFLGYDAFEMGWDAWAKMDIKLGDFTSRDGIDIVVLRLAWLANFYVLAAIGAVCIGRFRLAALAAVGALLLQLPAGWRFWADVCWTAGYL